MRVVFSVLVCLMYSAIACSQEVSLSGIDYSKLHETNKSIWTKVYSAIEAGKLTAYASDSLELGTPLTGEKMKERITPELGNICGVYGSYQLESSFLEPTQKKNLSGLAPLYQLTIEGANLGQYPLFYVRTDELAKVLNEHDRSFLILLVNLTEGVTMFSDRSDTLYQTFNSFLNKELTKASLNKTDVRSRSGYSTTNVELIQTLLMHYTRDILVDNLQFKQNISPYKSAKLKRKLKEDEVRQLISHQESFMIPDPDNPGKFKDTVVMNIASFSKANEIYFAQKYVSIEINDNRLYYAIEDLKTILPEWYSFLIADLTGYRWMK